MLYTLLISLFLIAAIIQLCYAILFRYAKRDARKQPIEPASIIICAKNEGKNLRQFLPFVLQQDYPSDLFEVIVVDDQSTDNSAEVLRSFTRKYPQLRIVTIEQNITKTLPGKKYALSQGIATAKFEQLLLTDADCKPSSDQWLKKMTGKQSDIVLGYGAYETHPGLLNKFIRWETAHTCMQYTSYASTGMTYMGVGRNLSYQKSLLKNIANDKTFQQIYTNTPSGDDDLLICKIANKDNVAVCLDIDAHTISIPQKTWATWWTQKTRHASTGKYYPKKIKNLLGLYGLSHGLYWLLGLPLFITTISAFQLLISDCLVLVLFTLRLVVYGLNASFWYKQLNEKKMLLFYPVGDLGWALYNVFLSPYILWKNKQAWK